MKNVVIGIDIGGTNTKIGIVDNEGNCIADNSLKTAEYESFEDYLSALKSYTDKLVGSLNTEVNITGIGLGAPNGNFFRGTIEFAPNLKWKGILHVTDKLKKSFNISNIVLTNDANAAAIGEMVFGAAKGMKDFIVITLGTGIGSGIVVNGELVYGNDGFAGEIGHVIVEKNGRQCGCGRKGCIEAYASAPGIVNTVLELLESVNEKSVLRDIEPDKITAKQIAMAAGENDKIALMAFDQTSEKLGFVLANSVAHLSPEAIFLFGGLSASGKLIFTPTKKYMEDYLLNIYKNKVKILPSGLPGSEAAILGAAALAWKN